MPQKSDTYFMLQKTIKERMIVLVAFSSPSVRSMHAIGFVIPVDNPPPLIPLAILSSVTRTRTQNNWFPDGTDV